MSNNNGSRNVSVLGIGRVGLPMALIMAEAGYKVFGIDVRDDYIQTISNGKFPFMEDSGQELLDKNLNKNFFPTTDSGKVKESDFIVFTLGTPVDDI